MGACVRVLECLSVGAREEKREREEKSVRLGVCSGGGEPSAHRRAMRNRENAKLSLQCHTFERRGATNERPVMMPSVPSEPMKSCFRS